jgi:hypothetical protein
LPQLGNIECPAACRLGSTGNGTLGGEILERPHLQPGNLNGLADRDTLDSKRFAVVGTSH